MTFSDTGPDTNPTTNELPKSMLVYGLQVVDDEETTNTDIVYVQGSLLIEGVRRQVEGMLEVTFNDGEEDGESEKDEPEVVHVRGTLLIDGVPKPVEGNLEVSDEEADQNWGDDPDSDTYFADEDEPTEGDEEERNSFAADLAAADGPDTTMEDRMMGSSSS